MRINRFNTGTPGYYSSVDTSSATTLRATLHDVIDDHQRFPYTADGTDAWDILESADEDPSNASNVLDVYRNASYPKEGGGNSNYQREHSWPKSYGFPHNTAGNYAYTDCHHLFIADGGYNASRSNKPYGMADPTRAEKPTNFTNGEGGGSGVYPGNSNWTFGQFTAGRWEVWGHRRGEIARAMFYMDVRYEGGIHGGTGHDEPDLVLTDDQALIAGSNTESNEPMGYMGLLQVLLQWHEEDPVDDREERRNNIIFGFQNNRNPFVDHPEWVAILYGPESGVSATASSVWINELHYDNAGADIEEFIEVAGEADTDLTGWTLVLYNWNSRRSYRTINLSGSIPDQQGGFGTVSVGATALQNGPQDGIALVNDQGTVVQFLSYEGTLVALDGPAAGQTSMNIGASESGSTPAGSSLQLVGTGTTYSHFTWHSVQPSTPGQRNTGQIWQ